MYKNKTATFVTVKVNCLDFLGFCLAVLIEEMSILRITPQLCKSEDTLGSISAHYVTPLFNYFIIRPKCFKNEIVRFTHDEIQINLDEIKV